MLRTQRSHVHGLQSAQSSIVLYLHAGEVFQRIGDGGGAQTLQRRARKLLRRREIVRPHAHHRHVADGVYGVGHARRLLCAARREVCAEGDGEGCEESVWMNHWVQR